MTTDSPKKQLMIAKQYLDKLSLFIINLCNFYKGIHPDLDSDLLILKKHLSGKPDYDSASELSIEINEQLKSDNKKLIQKNLDYVSKLETNLRKAAELEFVEDTVKQQIADSINDLKVNDSPLLPPTEALFKGLEIFKSIISNQHTVRSKHNVDKSEFEELHEKITQELKELIAPLYAEDKTNKNLVEVYQKLSIGIEHQALLECCLNLIRHVIRDLLDKTGDTSKFINKMHSSLTKINKGLSATIASSNKRSEKRQEENKSIQAQLERIELVITDTSVIEDLKLQTQIELAKMQEALEQNHMEEYAEHEKLLLLMKKMQERIKSLEHESAQYKEKLFKQRTSALIDPLTQLPNRMAYEERMQREMAKGEKTGTPLSLAIIDIDLFKSVNDKFGHSVGDKTLQIIASNLQKHLGNAAFTARWGGEEFVSLFSGQNFSESLNSLELARQKISELPFKFKGKRVQITISAGLCQVAKGSSLETVFEIADGLLYQAKQQGRNQVVTDEAVNLND